MFPWKNQLGYGAAASPPAGRVSGPSPKSPLAPRWTQSHRDGMGWDVQALPHGTRSRGAQHHHPWLCVSSSQRCCSRIRHLGGSEAMDLAQTPGREAPCSAAPVLMPPGSGAGRNADPAAPLGSSSVHEFAATGSLLEPGQSLHEARAPREVGARLMFPPATAPETRVLTRRDAPLGRTKNPGEKLLAFLRVHLPAFPSWWKRWRHGVPQAGQSSLTARLLCSQRKK